MPVDRMRFGIDTLLGESRALLAGLRVGLVTHQAAVDAAGCPSSERLHAALGDQLTALFTPEHGLFGTGAAGEKIAGSVHPSWGLPVHSLYGKTRRPTAAMLKEVDALVFDIQDLSIRCYTYVSTLRYVLEAAAAHRIRVVVADRPNPLAHVVDGPMLDPAFESFVGNVPGPFVYGLTAGEAALYLKKALKLKVDLTVVPVTGWTRGRLPDPAAWVSPSPAIRHAHSALCYPVTVGFEALPAIHYGRTSMMPFELIGAPSLDEYEFADRMAACRLPGIAFHPAVFNSGATPCRGVRIAVLDPMTYRPAEAAVAVLETLQAMIGPGRLWRTRGSRPRFFDQLFGTDAVRRALQSGTPRRTITKAWSRAKWERAVRSIRLYSA